MTEALRRNSVTLRDVQGHLDAGVPVDSVVINKETFLTLSAHWGHGEIVRELITRGAPLDWQNIHGDTALTYAIRRERLDITNMLLDAGASVVLCGAADPRSPLQLAARNGWSDVEEKIKALMEVQLTADKMKLESDLKPLRALRLKTSP